MSIKARFAEAQRQMLSDTIELADGIAVGRTTLRQLTSTECRHWGDQFAAASMVLSLCAEDSDRAGDPPAVIGLYARFARDLQLNAERALMICGEFESMTRADEHVDKLRHMMQSQLSHFGIDARILLDAAIQQVGGSRRDPRRPSSSHPAG